MALDPITAGIDLVKTAIDKIWPDASEEQKQKVALIAEELAGQRDINKIEASNANVFVSGWRPFIGWVCGIGLGYAVIIEPILRFASQVWFSYAGVFPSIDTDLTLQILLGMLGLGGLRTWEKQKGVARK